MNYAEMSDFEINKLVTKHLLTDGWKYNEKEKGFIFESDGDLYRIYDYCNNPSDAWLIIVENDIMLNPNCADLLWKAEQGFRVKPSGFYDVAVAYNKNPLRAAMIVFLMMNEDK